MENDAVVQQSAASGKWRIGHKVPLNVYKGDYPVCQCHTPQEALEIVDGMNAKAHLEQAAHDTWHLIHGLMAMRDGATDELLQECTDELLQECADALQAALAKARGEVPMRLRKTRKGR